MNESTRNGKAYWSVLEAGDWRMLLAAGDAGLLFVGGPNESTEAALRRFVRVFPRLSPHRDDERLMPYAAQLGEYLRGERRELTFPLDEAPSHGTPFRRAVRQALRDIPYGQTISYAELARRVGKPSAARAAGSAAGANPLLLAVPCHRVVGSDGSLTGYRGGLDMKRRLLELERGVVMPAGG